MTEKDDSAFIYHILDSINAIEKFSIGVTKEELNLNRLKQSAIIREIEIIGEAVKNISFFIKNQHPEVRWKEIAGTRDKLIHHYFGIDSETIWEIIKKDLPSLKDKILKIQKEII